MSTRSVRTRYIAGLLSVLLGLSVYLAPAANAFAFVVPAPSYPDVVTVGQTFPAAIGITNASTPPESVTLPVLRITNINHVPACPTASPAPNCSNVTPEAGVFALSPTGVGIDGPTCTGTWTITETSPGVYRLIPPGGEGQLLLAAGETCVVSFTATALRVPSTDVNPGTPGVQTRQLATVVPTSPDGTVVFPPNSGGDFTTVLQAQPGIVTTAAQSGAQVPATTTDTATLTPPPPPSGAFGAPPTGTVTFNLFGPFPAGTPPTCTGAPFASQQVPVNGPGPYTTPTPVNIASPGTYTWVASYSGNANYLPATSACGDPAETVSFAQAAPTIVTQATPTVTIGSTAQDVATLSGGFNPTGTITFNAFGPFPPGQPPTCTGAPVYTSTVPVNGNGVYTSTPPFTPPAPGVYYWTASYSGDANNAPAVSPCGAPNEQTTANQAQADTTPPTCALTAVITGPPKQIQVTVQDTGSGLASIQVTSATNATVEVPPFAPGTTAPVVVTASKVDQLQGSSFTLQITDVAGNVANCDPVDTTVIRDSGQPVTQTFTGLPQAESKVEITNGTPGVTNLELTVNGKKFGPFHLDDGQTISFDVASAMKPGSDNTITLTARGKPGGSAAVLVHD